METTMPTEMLIGELADAAGVGVETLRFYEREGLLPEPARSDAGYRLYDTGAVRRVLFIRKAKDLGFTLAETRDLLELRVSDTSACDDVAERARRKIATVEGRIRELDRIRRVLHDLVGACAERVETSDCSILEMLEDHEPDVWT
ncbi:MAG: heavy metal-responsive transcriptional regulator [Longimicrobiales bacterium]|nr:heavy metal-responsive transcriptional regulator [Longimicrobiales bacterium]